MHKFPARALSLLLAALLTAGCLGGMAVTASAQEPSPQDAYVLRFEGEGAKPYLYGSRYEFQHSYNDPAAGENSVWTYWNCPEIFNLVNTEDGSSIAVYCTDVDTSTQGDTSYRRINLEDSTYHQSGAAQTLRSILLNTFPKKTVAEVQAAAVAAGYAVTELAQGELISATQQAIWKTTHGDKYTVDDHSTGLRGMGSYDEADFVYPDSLEATLTDYTASNVENLYRYFLSMPGTPAMNDAVSEYTFDDVQYAAEQKDGSYTVTVTFTVSTTVDPGDSLTLRATCGSQVHTEALQAGANTVTFTGMAAQEPVKLEIFGYEQGGDVYLFDALGDRAVSQSMIGYDDSKLPVYGTVTAGPDRILKLHKTTGDDQKTPLSNIQFSIYEVGSLADYLNGSLAIGAVPTEADVALYATEARRIATVTTDTQGIASCSLGQTDRVYLVVEEPNPAVEAPVDPFFVCIPFRDADSGEWIYTLEVSPKNTPITEDVVIEKDVTQIDNDSDTFDVGQVHTWIIQSSIPAGMASGTGYVITDTLDYRLTYQDNLAVSVAAPTDPAKTETLFLTEDSDYTVTTGTATDAAGNTADTFTVSLTAAGMQKVAAAAAASQSTCEVRVYFDAVINRQAGLGVAIPNQAHVDYTNNVGLVYSDDSDQPEVHTGGLNIRKISAEDGSTLAGATFKLARPATAGETPDLTIMVEGQELGLVYVSFYATADLSGEKVSQVTTGDNGLALLYGVAYGDYYLIETAAPQGYNKLEGPVAAKVTATSHTLEGADGSFVTVRNSAKFRLPDTGGMGTTLFTVTGVSLMVIAGILLFISQKKKYSA